MNARFRLVAAHPGEATPALATDEVTLSRRARQRARRRRALVYLARVVIAVVFLGGWELAARAGWIDTFFWGQPTEIWNQLVTWVRDGTSQGSLWLQIEVTVREAFWGFVIGVVLGVISGITLGRIRFLADVFGPYIKMANSIPRIVLASLFVVTLGLGERAKIATAVVLVFFSVFFNAFQGAREVDRNLVANAKILGASDWRITTHVVLPSAMTWIIASLHTAFGFALIGAIVGEFVGASKGLGLLIRSSQGSFLINGVYAGMFILGAVALIAEALITALENRLLAWRPPQLTNAGL